MSEDLKYGWRRGGKVSTIVTMVGSENIQNRSGKFIFMNAGAATLCDDSTQTIFGHLETELDTSTSADQRNCIIDITGVFRIPVTAGTFVIGMVGDEVDIDILSNIQGADLTASTHNIITIIGGDLDDNNFVDVMMTPREWNTSTGVEA